ncbi:MAG: HD domain-containing protein [Candidatus Zixiibacteriota bacterium]|jgi:putative nucleotidyltransferase with HDIG domain
MTFPDDFNAVVAALGAAADEDSALREMMSERRYDHSRGAAELAETLARQYGHPAPALVRRAALLHDVGRVLTPRAMKGISDWRGWPPDDVEKAVGPGLLHGPAGAAVASALGLPAEGAAAIRYHVTGRPEPTLADRIIMAADAAEESRSYAWAPPAREALAESLDLAVAFWLIVKAGAVRAAGRVPHSRSAETLATLDGAVVRRARRLAEPFL